MTAFFTHVSYERFGTQRGREKTLNTKNLRVTGNVRWRIKESSVLKRRIYDRRWRSNIMNDRDCHKVTVYMVFGCPEKMRIDALQFRGIAIRVGAATVARMSA